MNKFEALAYMSKNPDNKVYRTTWEDGTKWIRLTSPEKGLDMCVTFGQVKKYVSVLDFLYSPSEGDLEDDWRVYEETYTVGQALDNVLASKGKLFAVGPDRDTYRSFIVPDPDDIEDVVLTYSHDPIPDLQKMYAKVLDLDPSNPNTILEVEATGWTIHNVPPVDTDSSDD